jgi:hypothetical protein
MPPLIDIRTMKQVVTPPIYTLERIRADFQVLADHYDHWCYVNNVVLVLPPPRPPFDPVVTRM